MLTAVAWVGPSESRSMAPPIPLTWPLSEYCQNVRLGQAEGIDGTDTPHEASQSGTVLNAALLPVQVAHHEAEV